MTFVLYIYAVVLVRTVGNSGALNNLLFLLPRDQDFWTEHYGTVLQSMFTLFEFMSQPDLMPYHDKVQHNPGLAMFVFSFIIIVNFGTNALLTGVISESMFEKKDVRAEEGRIEWQARRGKL